MTTTPPLPTVCDVLTTARVKITDPEDWTQRAYARDTNGTVISENHPNAARWCAVGAIYSQIPYNTLPHDFHRVCSHAFQLLERTTQELYDQAITWVNDATDGNAHGNILRAFDETIARHCAADAPTT